MPHYARTAPLLVVAWALMAGGVQASERQVLHGHVPTAVAKLQPIGRLEGTRRLRLAIGLPLRDSAGLDQFLARLYDPASPDYRHYLTPKEFADRFGPTIQDYEAVAAFAKTNALTVTARHPNRVVLSIEAAAADIERAFHLTFRVYNHPTEPRTFFAPDTDPSLDLAVPIQNIEGLDDYWLPKPRVSREQSTDDRGQRTEPEDSTLDTRHLGSFPKAVVRPDSGTGLISPKTGQGPSGTYAGNDFRQAYVPGTTLTGAGQNVGLLQFDTYNPSDITAYETEFNLPNVPLTNVPVDGGVSSPGSQQVEVCLDIEMVISMAPGVSRIYVYEAPNPSPWADLLSQMANDNLAKSLSCSWGGGGPDATSETIFKQMASQGQTFFNASGDSDAFTGSIPFPSDSTNIVEVGGTTLSTSGPNGSYTSETVWNWGGGQGSSGGISTYYGIPSYQVGISMSQNMGSTTLRNVPDVALTADNVFVREGGGSSEAVGGTSCAAPLWAGFTALVNQQAVASGQTTVGFLNPALYTIGQGARYNSDFNDITSGNNEWSSSPNQFVAVAGYDLCTGWGSPNGTNLINALAGPPIIAPTIVSNGFLLVQESCTNGVIDPGETVTVSIGLKNAGTGPTTNLVVALLTGGGVVSPSAPQTYGALAAAGGAASMPFSFIATGTCGGTITLSLGLQDGPVNLGTNFMAVILGQPGANALFSQNFDQVTAPALPPGWATSTSGAESAWVTSTSQSDTSPNSAFSPDPASVGLNELDSPPIPLGPGPAQLSFRQFYDLEYMYDGGVLEIKIGSGAWTDITSAGGSFVSGGYTVALSTQYGNPLGGRSAWSGTSGGFISTVVNLPSSAQGQTIQLRWRCATDESISSTGWWVDTISMNGTTASCCANPPSITASPQGETAAAGANVPFGVTAAGSYPLAYQWLLDGTNIPGASASSYTRTNVQSTDAGSYSVLVTNFAGSATSAVAVLNVLASPLITSQPTNVVTGLGLSAVFAVTAYSSGSPLAYQWLFNTAPIPGATSNVLSFTRVAATNAGTYSVLITNSYGSALSSNAVLVVLDPYITTQPKSVFVGAGGTAAFSVGAVGTPPLRYQWAKGGTNLSDAGRISGSATANLTISNLQASDLGSYTVLLSNTNGAMLSSNAVLSGPFPPVVAVQPVSQTVVAGSSARFSAGASGQGPFYFQWQSQGTNLVDNGKVSGSATANLTISNVQGNDIAWFSVIVSNNTAATLSSNALLSLWPMASWGSDSSGQADLPPGLTNILALACGALHELALLTNGSLVAWGAGTTNSGLSPNFGQAIVPAGLTNVAAVVGGAYHTLALKQDGTVVAWGLNTSGQTNVPAGLSDVVTIGAGSAFSVAGKADGTVAAWGQNTFGQTSVPAGLSNTVALAAGSAFCVAMRSDGTVIAWGRNNSQQTNVPAGLSNVVAVAAGTAFALALQANGIVVAWGANDSGQTNVPPGLTNVVAIACGSAHALALKNDGTLVAWGNNTSGQAIVPPGVTNVIRIAAGGSDNLLLEGPALQFVVPRITAITPLHGKGFVLQVSGGPGRFALDATSDLSAWFQLVTLSAPGPVFQFTDPQTNHATRFYRVRSLP